MAWFYDTSLSTDKDYVRFLIGDTNENNKLVQDETIEAVLANEANVWTAAAEICDYIARAVTAGGVLEDRKVGETRIKYRRAGDMIALAAQLRKRGAAHMKPSAGGIYTADRDAHKIDTSLDKPYIAKDIGDDKAIDYVADDDDDT